jgi:hypothetical protein
MDAERSGDLRIVVDRDAICSDGLDHVFNQRGELMHAKVLLADLDEVRTARDGGTGELGEGHSSSTAIGHEGQKWNRHPLVEESAVLRSAAARAGSVAPRTALMTATPTAPAASTSAALVGGDAADADGRDAAVPGSASQVSRPMALPASCFGGRAEDGTDTEVVGATRMAISACSSVSGE